MNFGEVVQLVGEMPCFDLALLVQAFDDRRESIRVQLSRWMKQGKVIGLRRGVYTLSDTYRRAALVPAMLADRLYRPSYLSRLWAMGHYDLIPERVVTLTSVTSRVPRRFENPSGVFEYRSIKQAYFFGFCSSGSAGHEYHVAEPEKALLDHWHLTEGEWTTQRLEEMRYQHVDRIKESRLKEYAARFDSPRLDRAVRRWLHLAAGLEEGTVTLEGGGTGTICSGISPTNRPWSRTWRCCKMRWIKPREAAATMRRRGGPSCRRGWPR